MVNFRLSLPPDLHEELREEAKRSGQPATALARDALRIVLDHRRRQRLHAQIAEFAAEHAGSALDLDEDLERSAGEQAARPKLKDLLLAESPRAEIPRPLRRGRRRRVPEAFAQT